MNALIFGGDRRPVDRSNRRAAEANEDVSASGVRAGNESAFSMLVRRHRHEVQVHCYRMLGSFHDAEDALQVTFVRAWRYRRTLKDDAPVRPWLYGIATNACLDAIRRDRRRNALAQSANHAGDRMSAIGEITWLQPFPDSLLEPAAPRKAEPDTIVVTKENIELAFLTAIQLLTPQQRAALILCEVVGWSAQGTAAVLETTIAAVNGSLQRARATLRAHLPARKAEWPAATDASEAELLRRYIDASERGDPAAFEAIIREDALFRMPPEPTVTVGRDEMIALWVNGGFGSDALGRLRCLQTRANRQPAVAHYLARPGDETYKPLAIDVLRIEEGLIVEIIAFPADLFAEFDLPTTLGPPA